MITQSYDALQSKIRGIKRVARHILFITVALMAVFGAVFAGSGLCYAADPPDADPTIEEMNVYRNLLETGDRLFVTYFNLPYTATPPTLASETYIWELLDTDGVTVLGSTVGYSYVNDGYGYQVISMYFSAADNVTWNPGVSYTLRLQGNPSQFVTPPEYNYPVSSAYYTILTDPDDVSAELTNDILFISDELDINWGLTDSLIVEEEAGRYLSQFGSAYFRGAIFSIQAMAPDLFPMGVENIEIEPRTWTNDYVDDLDDQYIGTWVETTLTAGALLFGVDFNLLGIILTAMFIIGIVVANVYVSSDQWNSLVDACFVMVVVTRIGMFGLGYLSLIAALCIIYLGVRLKQIGIFG